MKNLLEYLGSIKGSFAYGDRIQPARDWFVLLMIAIVFFVASVFWNMFLFEQFVNGKVSVSNTATSTIQSTTDSVLQVQQIFQKRALEETNYQQNYHFVDPSLPGA